MANPKTPPPGDNPAPEDAKAKGGYRAVTPVRANKKHFDAGDTVTGLTPAQAAELLALGMIQPASKTAIPRAGRRGRPQ